MAGARARFVPFLFERCFQFLGANFFLAQIFHLQRKLLARGFEVGLFLKQRAVLLVQCDRSLARQRHLLHEPLLGGFRARKTLGHRGKCFALRHHLLLQRMEIAAQLGEPLGRACGVGFRVGAGTKRLSVFVARLLHAIARRFRFLVQPRNLLLLGGKLLLHTAVFRARLIARVHRAYK